MPPPPPIGSGSGSAGAAILAEDSASSAAAAASGGAGGEAGKTRPKPSRRMSMKGGLSSEPNSAVTSPVGMGGSTVSSPQPQELAEEARRQLGAEREKYERLMVQMVVLNNDLNEREDQIIVLKKREAAFEEQLRAKDKMYEQDAMVRMQLGKRLEQVLMDKEEITDELDMLRDQLETFKSLVNQS